jgi:hypothetical protein
MREVSNPFVASAILFKLLAKEVILLVKVNFLPRLSREAASLSIPVTAFVASVDI